MNVRLVLYKDDKPDISFPLADGGTGIGRDAGNMVQLTSPEVSKRHAFVAKTNAGWHLRDLDSRNGLYINGNRVREAILCHGDRVTIGPYKLIFETDDPGSVFIPGHVVDLSTNVEHQTIPRVRRTQP